MHTPKESCTETECFECFIFITCVPFMLNPENILKNIYFKLCLIYDVGVIALL